MFVWIFAEWLCCCSAYWEEMSGLFMPVHLFLYLQTMEKLQLYSPRRLCYNSLVSELRGALGGKYLLAAMLPQGGVSEGGVS